MFPASLCSLHPIYHRKYNIAVSSMICEINVPRQMTQPTNLKPSVQLTCVQCQQRKRKCDKQLPCQSCRHRGIECIAVTRARRPRGRQAARRNTGVEHSVSRLETLLETHGSHNAHRAPDDWARTAAQEVAGLRELLITDGDSDHEEHNATFTPSTTTNPSCDGSSLSHPSTPASWPSKAVRYALLDIYLQRIDPVLKIIHPSSTRSLLLETPAPTCDEGALVSAIFFAAICSLDEQECLEINGEQKSVLLQQCRNDVEVLLKSTNLYLNTTLTTLQAFVLYMIGLRTIEGWRPIWSLVAVASRLAQMLGFNRNENKPPTYATEMQRRVWYTINILELQAALDGGSFSAYISTVSLGPMPLHVNDSDISAHRSPSATSFTSPMDMTFASMTHSMLQYIRRLVHNLSDSSGRPLLQQQWSARFAIASDCAQLLTQRYLCLCDTTTGFGLFTRTVGEDMILTISLLARRPIYPFLASGPPPDDGFDVLATAIEVLSRGARKYTNPQFRPWRWFAWNKWYALAILLAELCEHTSSPQFEYAWMVAETAYQYQQDAGCDGAIRNAMSKLMQKALLRRRQLIFSSASHLMVGRQEDVRMELPKTGIESNAQHLEPSPDIRCLDTAATTTSDQVVTNLDDTTTSWLEWDEFVNNVGYFSTAYTP